MIPTYLTDTFAGIPGEFANTGGPFVSPIGFDPSHFPASLVSIAGFTPPKTNPFQLKMLQTILTQTGRSELFTNPFTSDLPDIRSKLNALIAAPGTGSEGDAGSNLVAPAATDLLETLVHFEAHTDRLSGVVETDATTSKYPTLEKALAVGSSLDHVHQLLDVVPTNAPQLSLFSSFFVGKEQFSKLKNILTLADSQIIATELKNVSSTLITSAQNDVANYTIGLKKLKRIGIASMVFGAQNKQVESEIFKLVTTKFTQGLFQNDATKRDADQVALTQKRLEDANTSRTTTTTYTRDFKEIPDLFREHGLFEGIPLTLGLLNTLRASYPKDKPGIFNTFLNDSGYREAVDQSAIDYINTLPQKRGFFLLRLLQDYLSRHPQTQTTYIQRGDIYFDAKKIFGSVSRILANEGLSSGNAVEGQNLLEAQVLAGPPGVWRKTTDAEDAIIRLGLRSLVDDPIIGQCRLFFYGITKDFYGWRGMSFPIGENPDEIHPGQQYINGRWQTA